jgi:hypothetical protein
MRTVGVKMLVTASDPIFLVTYFKKKILRGKDFGKHNPGGPVQPYLSNFFPFHSVVA